MIHIVLYQPEIPSNTGNIIRTCSALNAKLHLIKPLGFSLEEKELKRASMDYINLSDITIYENFEEFLFLHENDTLYMITRYAQKTYADVDFSNKTEDIYFLFGKESSGLPYDFLRKHEDKLLRIPMKPEARSLNISNSVAIIAYEASRQQDFFGLSTFEAIKGFDFLKEEKNEK